MRAWRLSSFTSATLALAWTTGAYTSEIIRAGLDAVPYGQKEAAAAIGLSGLDALRYVILPQGLRVSIPPLFGFSILMLQASSLCFAIALPELVSQAYVIGSNTFPLHVDLRSGRAALCGDLHSRHDRRFRARAPARAACGLNFAPRHWGAARVN